MFLSYIDPGNGITILNSGGWMIIFLIAFFGACFGFLYRYKKFFIIFFLFLAVLFIIIGVIMNKKSGFDRKVVVLGFDGIDPKLIEKMMDDGELPNFADLRKTGSYEHLETTNPSQSPVAWASFAAGLEPGKTGIFDFIIRDPGTYRLSTSISNFDKDKPGRVIKNKCFWNYLSRKKIPAVIIKCPLTFPPDKVYGKMLSGMGVPDILGTEGTFSFYTSEFINDGGDTGGKVFHVNKSDIMIMDLTGPRILKSNKSPENIKIPFKVTLLSGKKGARIEFQNNKFNLNAGEWSGWKEVVFKTGAFKKIRGILKFYLIETEPEFKLYATPVNFDPRKPFFPISYPGKYAKELADKLGLYYTQGMPIDTWAVNEERLSEENLLEQMEAVFKQDKAVFDFEFGRFEKGVFFYYFGSTDTVQHMFWKYTDPLHPLYEDVAAQKYKNVIRDWYRKADNILGDAMKKLNETDTVIVLSDHGFNSFRRAVHVNAWLKQNGYLALKDPAAAEGRELLADIDWPKTRAYALGFGAIYINQKGRERDGIVEPGEKTDLLKKEIAQKIALWNDEKYNKKVVNNIYFKEDIFSGKENDVFPDLYAGFNIGYRASWQTALGGVPGPLIEDNLKKWSGDHLFDPVLVPGVVFSNRRITKKYPCIRDISPTILKAAGFNDKELKECGFDGEPIINF